MTDWEFIAKSMSDKVTLKNAEIQYLNEVLRETSAELQKCKYNLEKLRKKD
jgi:hypothetical protein